MGLHITSATADRQRVEAFISCAKGIRTLPCRSAVSITAGWGDWWQPIWACAEQSWAHTEQTAWNVGLHDVTFSRWPHHFADCNSVVRQLFKDSYRHLLSVWSLCLSLLLLVSPIFYHYLVLINYSPYRLTVLLLRPDRGAEYCDQFVCLSVCPQAYLWNR